jgi:hypothetical protein
VVPVFRIGGPTSRTAVNGARYACGLWSRGRALRGLMNPKCAYCKGLGWVCENYPHLSDELSCQCGHIFARANSQTAESAGVLPALRLCLAPSAEVTIGVGRTMSGFRALSCEYEEAAATGRRPAPAAKSQHGQYQVIIVHRGVSLAERPSLLVIRASAKVNNSGSKDLWLSATCAVVNGGQWPPVASNVDREL